MLVRLKDEVAANENTERDTMMSPEFEERLNNLRININTNWSNLSTTDYTWTINPTWWGN